MNVFTPFAAFKDGTYRPGGEFPHPTLGYVQLTAGGGHTGRDGAHAAIRRWTAPQDAVVSIKGQASHPSPSGDGIEARIVSSRAGSLGSWTVHNSKAETNVDKVEVKRGDTIDFVASCRESDNTDSFGWTFAIVAEGGQKSWDSSAGFKSPPPPPPAPLGALERYAQVLLMTNEFFFVD